MLTQVVPDDEAAAQAAARFIEGAAREAVAERGHFDFAVSGGRSPWRMLEILSEGPMPWSRCALFQVDERIAPTGSPERNLTHLVLSLPLACQAAIRPMPVGAKDLENAGSIYEYSLPERFDLIHLGLGPDGHTASLVPGDAVLDVTDRKIAVTGTEYQGTHRMTMTYPVLERARKILFLVTGAEKREALDRLLAGDETIPAGRVETSNATLITDIAPE